MYHSSTLLLFMPLRNNLLHCVRFRVVRFLRRAALRTADHRQKSAALLEVILLDAYKRLTDK